MRAVPFQSFPLFLALCLALAPVGASATVGKASWYGPGFEGRRMANGCAFRASRLLAASRVLPLGTWARVRLRDRSVIVQIADRGPYVAGRAIDLSRGAAERLGMLRSGVASVSIEPLAPRGPLRHCR